MMGGGRKRKVTAKAANPVTVTSKVTLARQTEAWLSTFDWPTLSNRSLSLNPATHTRTRAPDTPVISPHHTDTVHVHDPTKIRLLKL